MSRFVKIGVENVNVDRIRRYWDTYINDRTVLNVELDNGDILKDSCPITKNFIEGWDHIVQVIPCIKPLYKRYTGENGEIWEEPVYYLGLCASGYVRPLEIFGCEGVMFADDISNFLGLYTETMTESEGKQ